MAPRNNSDQELEVAMYHNSRNRLFVEWAPCLSKAYRTLSGVLCSHVADTAPWSCANVRVRVPREDVCVCSIVSYERRVVFFFSQA